MGFKDFLMHFGMVKETTTKTRELLIRLTP